MSDAREPTEQEVAAVAEAIKRWIQRGINVQYVARAAIAAMPSGWRPIEEAPESTRVLGEFCAGRWKPDSGPYRTALDARIDPSVRCVHVLFHMGRFEGERAICTSYYEFPSPVVIHSLPEPKP